MERRGTVIGKIYCFLDKLVFVFRSDRRGVNGRREMMIRLFLLMVRVLTPFYWTERGEFRGRKVIYRLVLAVFFPLSYPTCPSLSASLTPTPLLPYRSPPISVRSVSLKLQKRLAASVLKCRQHITWINPNEIPISNSRRDVAYINRYGLIINIPIVVHSRYRVLMRNEVKKNGHHTSNSSAQIGFSWLTL